jgi:hypothetical protein
VLAAGFESIFVRDTSAALAEALAPVLKQLETEGLPPLGEHIVRARIPRDGGSIGYTVWLKAGF